MSSSAMTLMQSIAPTSRPDEAWNLRAGDIYWISPLTADRRSGRNHPLAGLNHRLTAGGPNVMNEQPTRETTTMSNGEVMIRAGGIELCAESFGSRGDPAILLIHGACASMLWWETDFCAQIAARNRFVIRYDNRDTGRSTFYTPQEPLYKLTDMARDAVAILDAFGVQSAHVVGQSMAGGIALVLAVDHADRVESLTLVATTPGDDDLPGMSPSFLEYTSKGPDASDAAEVEEFIVGLMRVYGGGSRYFDEESMRALARLDVARTRSMEAALTNHFRIDFDGPQTGGFDDVSQPTLIIHGTRDPVFPAEHARRMQKLIKGSRLLLLADAGHELPRPLWGGIVDALIEHTAPGGSERFKKAP